MTLLEIFLPSTGRDIKILVFRPTVAKKEAAVDVYPDWYHAYDMFFPFKKKAKAAIAKFEAEFVCATEKYFREQNN